jgi:hypothetical protein
VHSREPLGQQDRVYAEGTSPSTGQCITTNGFQARAQFKRRSTANNVQISIPVPEDADTPRFRTNIGTVHYAPETSSIVWKIKQFGGGKEFLMRAELGLPSVRGDDEKGGGMMGGFGGSMGGVGAGKGKRPINVKFEIPYFTTSGIQVRYLKIIEPKVSLDDCVEWVHANMNVAAIPFAALGTVHYAIRRYSCAVTRRQLAALERGSRMNIPTRSCNDDFHVLYFVKSLLLLSVSAAVILVRK